MFLLEGVLEGKVPLDSLFAFEGCMRDTIEDFNFWMPIQKAGDPRGEGTRKFKGVASTSHKDLQDECVQQHGVDFAYFMKHGYFNNDHKAGFENKVGYPTSAKMTKDGLYVEGVLFNNHKVADNIWKLMHSMDATPGNKRKLGMSIQGKVKRRMGKQILNCWIQDVAITPAPVNTKTWMEVVKSLGKDGWVEPSEEPEEKALAAGYGSPLVPESLDSDAKDQLYGDRRKRRKLNKSQAIEEIQLLRGYSRTTAALLADVIFSHRE